MKRVNPSPTKNLRLFSDKGFTVTEFLVAMAILGILAPAITLCFRLALEATGRADQRMEASQEIRSVMSIMEEDLRKAFLPTAGSGWFLATDNTQGNQDADSLAFTCLGYRPPYAELLQNPTPEEAQTPLGDFYSVEYLFEAGGEGQPGRLLRLELVPAGEDSTDTESLGRQQLLSDRVVSLNFRYYDGSDWLDTWTAAVGTASEESASSESENQLPQAVEITLSFYEGTHLRTLTTVVQLEFSGANQSQLGEAPSEGAPPSTSVPAGEPSPPPGPSIPPGGGVTPSR